jgi:hypothetical protein
MAGETRERWKHFPGIGPYVDRIAESLGTDVDQRTVEGAKNCKELIRFAELLADVPHVSQLAVSHRLEDASKQFDLLAMIWLVASTMANDFQRETQDVIPPSPVNDSLASGDDSSKIEMMMAPEGGQEENPEDWDVPPHAELIPELHPKEVAKRKREELRRLKADADKIRANRAAANVALPAGQPAMAPVILQVSESGEEKVRTLSGGSAQPPSQNPQGNPKFKDLPASRDAEQLERKAERILDDRTSPPVTNLSGDDVNAPRQERPDTPDTVPAPQQVKVILPDDISTAPDTAPNPPLPPPTPSPAVPPSSGASVNPLPPPTPSPAVPESPKPTPQQDYQGAVDAMRERKAAEAATSAGAGAAVSQAVQSAPVPQSVATGKDNPPRSSNPVPQSPPTRTGPVPPKPKS